jgi:pimeloyl-ACP methyl ester carboxylesterase
MGEKPSHAAFFQAETEVFAGYSLTPRTRWLALEKPAISLRAIELGSGEPALFMHGAALCPAHWASLMSGLPSPRKIAIDMPGHGASDGVDYRGVDLRPWYKDLLTSSLDRLELESAHIVGHSMGAMIGMWLALDAPERVRSLVAIGTPAVAFGEGNLGSMKMMALPGIGRLMLSMPTPMFMYRRIVASFLGRHAVDTAPEALLRATYLGTRGADYATTLSSFLGEIVRGVRAKPQRYALSADELARIDEPMLIIWGQAEDGVFMSIAEARKKAALIPNARFEVLPGGHEPWLDDLQPCAELVSAFLSRRISGASRESTARPGPATL